MSLTSKLLDAVRGAFPDMADIVAASLRLQFAHVLKRDADSVETQAAVLDGFRLLTRDLDVALNGAAGAAKQASLVDLVAQVERERSAVSIVNFDDGMVINFRAPDGRRATLHFGVLMDQAIDAGGEQLDVWNTIAAAIAAYPSAGPRVPVETIADAAEKRAAGIKPDDARNLAVQRAPVAPKVCPRTGECEASPASDIGRCSTCGGWA